MNRPAPRRLFLVIGAPGSGKTTAAMQVAQRHRRRLAYHSMGELLRREMAAGSEVGQRVREYVEQGRLVPLAIVMEVFATAVLAGRQPLVMIDGFPRSVEQAKALDEWLGQEPGLMLAAVIEVVVSQATAAARVRSRGRGADDHLAVFHRRMREYLQVLPSLEAFYARRGLLVKIDGESTAPEVAAALEAVVLARA